MSWTGGEWSLASAAVALVGMLGFALGSRRPRASAGAVLDGAALPTASFVRHELRNTLTAASLHVAMIPEPRGHSGGLAAIRDALAHALELSDRLGDEPLGASEPARDAARVLGRCARMIRPVIERKGSLETELPDRLGRVALDAGELSELVINLLVNASEALARPGNVLLSARRIDASTAEIAVSDDGCGIPEEILDRIFSAGFSSKENGSGLGLARVRQLVSKGDGSIRIHSRPGTGTTFRVELPLIGESDAGAGRRCRESASDLRRTFD